MTSRQRKKHIAFVLQTLGLGLEHATTPMSKLPLPKRKRERKETA